MSAAAGGYHRLDVAQLANVPDELREGKRFICWRQAVRKKKLTKPPVDPHTGDDAETDNPVTWGTLDEAVTFYEQHRDTLHGVGRVLDPGDGMGLIGIDWDDCFDEHGHIVPGHPAEKWLSLFDSYTETSPSGRGAKTWVHASHVLGGSNGRKTPQVEIWRGGKYFTITGERLNGFSANVKQRQAQLDAFYQEYFPGKKTTTKLVAPTVSTFSDAEIISRANSAKNGGRFRALWAGDITGSLACGLSKRWRTHSASAFRN